MAKTEEKDKEKKILLVSSSPHLIEPASSKRIMYEVVFGMLPAAGAALYYFRTGAGLILAACVCSALLAEWLCNAVRKKEQTISDGSALITALILGLSLPPELPPWMAVIGTVVAIVVAKMLFGGLGSNIFNPAMVGRAFLMACFGLWMTTWTAPATMQNNPAMENGAVKNEVVAVTGPTPLSLAKQPIKDAANADKLEKATPKQVNRMFKPMFFGQTSGSLGETSAVLWLIGGVFLLLRKTITYHIPLAVLATAGIIATIAWWSNPEVYAHPLVHLFGGGLMMCAFFIATDPVTCPLTKLGRIIFGIGVGAMIMMIRLVGGYPEGVMYAVLLMNAMTPLLDRWTRTKPLGGHVSAK